MFKRIGLLGTLVIIIAVFVGLNQARNFWFKKAPKSREPIEVTIQAGDSSTAIAKNLEDEGLIKSVFWYKVYLKLSGTATNLKPGVFELTKGNSYKRITSTLGVAESEEIQITFPEGFSLLQMQERVVNAFDITEAEWRLATGVESPLESHEFVVSAQKPDDIDLEGYLFPSTYRFFADATAEDIVKRMIDEMQVQIALQSVAAPPDMTMHEVLTLASIVQKEVRHEEDMLRVAGIFHNRLDIGMPLQSDATVNYFTNKGMPSPTFADIEIEHPYNTYTIAGLPPGPIASPGIMAIRTTMAPEEHNYLFFLTSPDGTAYYAETFEQHVANRVYLR